MTRRQERRIACVVRSLTTGLLEQPPGGAELPGTTRRARMTVWTSREDMCPAVAADASSGSRLRQVAGRRARRSQCRERGVAQGSVRSRALEDEPRAGQIARAAIGGDERRIRECRQRCIGSRALEDLARQLRPANPA